MCIKCSNCSALGFANFSHFIEYVVISQRAFNLHFSDDLKVSTFSYVCWLFEGGLCKALLQYCILLLPCLCLFYHWFPEILYFGNELANCMHCKYLLILCSSPFTFFSGIFWWLQFINFNVIQLLIFSSTINKLSYPFLYNKSSKYLKVSIFPKLMWKFKEFPKKTDFCFSLFSNKTW